MRDDATSFNFYAPRSVNWTSELELWACCLAQAVRFAIRDPAKHVDDRAWLLSNDRSIGSFLWILNQLDRYDLRARILHIVFSHSDDAIRIRKWIKSVENPFGRKGMSGYYVRRKKENTRAA